MNIPTLPNAEFRVPRSLERLVDLAHNLWWSWRVEGRDLWPQIDPAAWSRYHNPIDLLASIDAMQWRVIEQVEAVHERYQRAIAEFDTYMAGEGTWFSRQDIELPGPIAYLCTEYGIHESLPFYSGGLGILAGDHTKSASDLGLPLVATGLLYRRGYFRQEVGLEGGQQHIYPTLDLRSLPVRPVASSQGGQLKVPIEFPDRDVYVAAWKLDVGRIPLLLLDTDIPENDRADRPITHQLYVAGREMRFCQELVLGVGAVRVLDALGIRPSAWHVNEGHAAMSVLERAATEVESGVDLPAARDRLRARTLFTLHTPVPAGNEVFDSRVAHKYLTPWAERLGTDLHGLGALASADGHDLSRFDLGALAIRFASIVNGVSKRHGEVVAADWQHLIDGTATSVTNGVHTPSWIGRQGTGLLRRKLGGSWATRLLEDESLLEEAKEIPDRTIWESHESLKHMFVRVARTRLRAQLARQGASPDELRDVESMFDPEILTLGFARRFATYKRATLMFWNRERLRSILHHPDRPVQVVFAGKAHPADQHGQAFIRQIVELSQSPEFRGSVYFIEDYDARLARYMVQGVDVWVNNPRPPMEASGTSGMKAAINGSLNMSVLDGWWLEGFDETNGWAFGSADANGDWAAADHDDAHSLYEVLSNQVAPMFYDRDPEGLPTEWIGRMRASIVSTIREFSSHRMVAEYAEKAYFPLATD